MKNVIISLLLCVCANLALGESVKRFSVGELEAAIRSGAIGKEHAERAKKTDNLHAGENTWAKVPYQVFSYSDFENSYTVLVNSNGRFLVLCDGLAYDYELKKENGKSVLYYKYDTGSGRLTHHRMKYIIGDPLPEKMGTSAGRD